MSPDTLIVGAGTMGYGLAIQFARHGAAVTVVDHRQSNLDEARERVDESLAFLDSEGMLAADADAVVDRIDYSLDLAAAAEGIDFALETVSEDIDVKAEVFGTLAEATEDPVLASNTSGLQITEIADTVPDAADRVVGCHWWNPPYVMPLVEVIRGEETSDETVERTTATVEAVERDPIVVKRDVPGFVWNRIQFAVLREATHIVEEGIASVEDVERAVRDGYALRTSVVGPFETADISGLDLFGDIAAELYPHLSNADEPGPQFDERVEDGRTGVAAGEGFRAYDESLSEVVRRRDETVAAVVRARGPEGRER